MSQTTGSYALVEIKCEDTLAFYQGYVKDVDRDHVLVAYEGGWQRDGWISVSSIRPALPPYNVAQFNPIPGEVVEVKAKSAENEPYSWWRGSVKSVRPNPALASLPDSLGSTVNQLIYEISYAGWENEFTESLEKEMLRPFNKQLCFTTGEVEKHTLPLSTQMAGLLTSELLQPIHYNSATLALFIEPAGTIPSNPPPSAAFLPQPPISTQPHIHVIGSKQNCQRAVILLANQLKLLNEQILLQQQALSMQSSHYGPMNGDRGMDDGRGGYQNRYDNSRHGYGSSGGYRQPREQTSYGRSNSPFSSHSSNFPDGLPYSGANPPVTLEFHCPPHLMGMVIGKRHKNLYIAENLDGIYKVHVDTENGSIVVIAKTMEAANGARSLLELTEQTLQIPSVIVGRVVGKNFSIIKEIEQHSGVLRIKVGDDRDHDLEFLQNLALNGIPGVSNVDENGNPRPMDQQQQAALGLTDKEKEKEKEKRSAFAITSYRDRESTRGGHGRGRGGRYQSDVDDSKEEEFDIVALEDDKTVDISIIGSPATVSEAELLLRTHIGLITQIYKLSYDEVMLKRQVEALSLVVPKLPGGPAAFASFGSYGSGERHGHGHGSERHGHGHGHEKRRAKEDTHMPAWMNDNNAHSSNKEEKLAAAPIQPRRKQDPSVNIHAARLEGNSTATDSTNAPTDGDDTSRPRRDRDQRDRSGPNRRRGGGDNRRGGRGGRRGPNEASSSSGDAPVAAAATAPQAAE